MAEEKQKTQKKETKKMEKKVKSENNVMRKARLEKVVLNCGGSGEKLERAVKLLQILTGRKVMESVSTKRIPSLGVRPGLKTGAVVTIRGKEKEMLLKRLFGAVNNTINKKQVMENHFSFGIKEYLEIPDMEYQRDIGIIGLDVTAVFTRTGKRVKLKKAKQGRYPKKQEVSIGEITDYLTKLGVNIE